MPAHKPLAPVQAVPIRAAVSVLAPTGPARLENARHVPLTDIDLNPQQARQQFSEDALDELAESIRQHGVLQPILVRPRGQRWEIVAGERRYRAALLAGLDTIPAILRDDLDTADALLVTALENLQREDLGAADEARQYQRLLDSTGLSQVKLGELLGINSNRISRLVRLLTQAPALLDRIDAGQITLRAALDHIAEHVELDRGEQITTADTNMTSADRPCHGDKITINGSNMVREDTPPERVPRADLWDARTVAAVPSAFRPVQRFARAVDRLQLTDVPAAARLDLATQLEEAAQKATRAARVLRQAVAGSRS
ncbi:MAG: ParB/RepB/Spo0J family partition protein [Chloroflexota bacterium]|nr:ParB/RepB/Spo0J family partition protein [Chloroflexota bacterium]